MVKKILPLTLLLLVFLLPARAARADAGASFAFTPASVAVSSGDQFSVGVVISADAAVNAAQGTVTFPTNELKVISVSETDSIFQFWAQNPTFSNPDGTVTFSGGLPSPGFTGENGQLFTIVFQASGRGSATVNITQGAILANDGQGTNVLKSISEGVYSVGAAGPVSIAPTQIANQITSQTYSNSNLWYNAPTADFAWTLPSDVDQVAYELTQTPGSDPSEDHDPIGQTEYSMAGKADGVWYFDLKLRSSGAWGPVLTKAIKVDRTPPSVGTIRETSQDPSDPDPSFAWSGSDRTSGIQGYRLQVSGGDWFSPTPDDAAHIALSAQAPGQHILTVEARDLAGNIADATTTFTVVPIAMPTITDYPHTISEAPSAGTTNPVITIKGHARQAASILLYLRNGSNILNFTVPVASDGSWQTSYSGLLSAGNWLLTARAVDVRGALSAETAPIIIRVNDLIGNLIQLLAAWGALILVVILALALIITIFLAAHAYVKRYRLKLRNEILASQMALVKDMERLQEDIGMERAAKIRKKVTDDAKGLFNDVEKELDHLKKNL